VALTAQMAGAGVRWVVRRVYFVVLASLTVGLIHAQEVTGSMRGRVTDASGAVVPHARISVKQIETGLTREAVADSDGAYLLVLLPVGYYRLEISGWLLDRVPGAWVAFVFIMFASGGILLPAYDVRQTATVG